MTNLTDTDVMPPFFDRVLERARNSRFGNSDPEFIKNLYKTLKILSEWKTKSFSSDPIRWIKSFIPHHETIRNGSGMIFNMQGFLEQPDLPGDIKSFILYVFKHLDRRDLNYRFGECNCISCTNPVLVLQMLLDGNYPCSKSVH